MDVSGVSGVSSTLPQVQGEKDTVGLTVLRKALYSEATSAAALIEALPPVVSTGNLPPNLGKNINTTA